MARALSIGEISRRCLSGQITLEGTRWPAVLKKALFASLAGGCLVLVLEPDHSAGLPLLSAFGLWSTHIFFALALFVLSLAVLLRLGLPGPLPAAAALLLLPVIFAPVSLLLDVGFGNPDEELASAAGLAAAYLSEVLAVVPVTVAAALVMSFVLYRAAALRAARAEAAGPVPVPAPAPDRAPVLRALFAGVPTALGDDIIRLHAQDHYVELVTAEGRCLLSERFSDCVERLRAVPGLQCHRSHWVSLQHVTGLAPSGSAYLCSLSNGDRVPVSRRRYAELKGRLDPSRFESGPEGDA